MKHTDARIMWDTCSFCGSDGTGRRMQDVVRHLFPTPLAGPQASICDNCVFSLYLKLQDMGLNVRTKEEAR